MLCSFKENLDLAILDSIFLFIFCNVYKNKAALNQFWTIYLFSLEIDSYLG